MRGRSCPMGEATPAPSPQGRCADAAGPSPEGATGAAVTVAPRVRGARPRPPLATRLWQAAGASGEAVTAAPRVRRRLRHYPHQHVRFSCSYSVPGTSSACFVQQTPIGRHQESHRGGEAPSQLAKPLVSFCSSREFPRVARLPLRRMSTYRSLLRKSKVFGNQMRVQVAIRWGVLRQGRRLLKKLASNDAPNGGLGMLDGAAPAPVGCFAFWLSGKSLMGSGIVR